MLDSTCRTIVLMAIAMGLGACYRTVELGRQQVAQLAVTDPGRIVVFDRKGHGHLLADAQSLGLMTEAGLMDCTDWGPATTAIRCTDGTMVPLAQITEASLRVASPARTTLIITGPAAIAAGLAAALFQWRGAVAEDRYNSLGPKAAPGEWEEYRGQAEAHYDVRNIALGIGIAAGIGVAAAALWGALFEE